jgi:hypothetical protein
MKVFISWSGALSKQIAETLGPWIEDVLQGTKAWISSEDIEKGSLWFSDVTNELKDTVFGVLCLTRENADARWILFEAGALSKGLSKNRVCPLLIDLTHTDVLPPLSFFNSSLMSRDDMLKLIKSINSANKDSALSDEKLVKAFDKWWLDFGEKVSKILNNYKPAKPAPDRPQHEIMNEILETVRALQKTSQEQSLFSQYRNVVEWANPENIKFHSPGMGISAAAQILNEAEQRRHMIDYLKSQVVGLPNEMLEKLTMEKLQGLVETFPKQPEPNLTIDEIDFDDTPSKKPKKQKKSPE